MHKAEAVVRAQVEDGEEVLQFHGRGGAAPVAGKATTRGGTAPAAGACSRGWGGGDPRRGRAPAAGEAANGDLRRLPMAPAAVKGAASRGSARGCRRRTTREEEEVVREEKVEVVRAIGFVNAG